jgi:hypothetical protein
MTGFNSGPQFTVEQNVPDKRSCLLFIDTSQKLEKTKV